MSDIKVEDTINPGAVIPDNVLEFRDNQGDVWSDRRPDDTWDSPDTNRFSSEYIARKWAPLTVTKVREEPQGSAPITTPARAALADVGWLGPVLARAALEALADRLPCYAQHHGMLCDRQTNHLGDHVDIYGPLPDHTWPREVLDTTEASG